MRNLVLVFMTRWLGRHYSTYPDLLSGENGEHSGKGLECCKFAEVDDRRWIGESVRRLPKKEKSGRLHGSDEQTDGAHEDPGGEAARRISRLEGDSSWRTDQTDKVGRQ